MNWMLVRFYLFVATLNCIISFPQSHANKNTSQKKHISLVGHSLGKKEKEKSQEDASKKGLSGKYLTVGDTFTPTEMLPIAKKLLNKVGEPGSGKGFVSSTYSPEELADKLFEAFFLTTKRIIILKDIDISGIDALQALALSGEHINDLQVDATTEAGQTMYLKGQFIKVKPKRSKYKLVTKIDVDKKDRSIKPKRRGIPLAKRLTKKRHLIIKERRDNREYQEKSKRASKKSKRKHSPGLNEDNRLRNVTENSSLTKTPTCHWRYECSNPGDLDTCRLHSECTKDSTTSFDEIPVKHKSDEHTLAIMQFRKMLGITAVDEEVEKILESRNMKLKTSNAAAVERAKNLAEYFKNVILEENLATTIAALPDVEVYNSTVK